MTAPRTVTGDAATRRTRVACSLARPHAGFTYLTVLFVLAFMGVGWSLAGEVWHTSRLRENEAELIFVGNQYRRAIELYFQNGAGTTNRYPRELADLLKDPRKPNTQRYLRQLYPDPITGKREWGLVKAPDGGIMGVHSLSDGRPVKIANFRLRDAGFEGKAKYSDWTFVHAIPAGTQAPPPSIKPAGK